MSGNEMVEYHQRLSVSGGRNVRARVLTDHRSNIRGAGCGLCGPLGCAGCPQLAGNQGSEELRSKGYHQFIERAIVALSGAGVLWATVLALAYVVR